MFSIITIWFFLIGILVILGIPLVIIAALSLTHQRDKAVKDAEAMLGRGLGSPKEIDKCIKLMGDSQNEHHKELVRRLLALKLGNGQAQQLIPTIEPISRRDTVRQLVYGLLIIIVCVLGILFWVRWELSPARNAKIYSRKRAEQRSSVTTPTYVPRTRSDLTGINGGLKV